MFYPSLVRRSKYKTKRNGQNFASYRRYSEEITEDCQFRCVYCDVKMDEVGVEGFHIDHFRPKKNFPELETEPSNLVLACSKCNILKSDDWPTECFDSISGKYGYIDPFVERRSDFFEVNSKGEILKRLDPADYMVKMLSLNRFSRVQVRRGRMLAFRYRSILDRVATLTDVIQSKVENCEDIKPEILVLKRIHDQLKEFG